MEKRQENLEDKIVKRLAENHLSRILHRRTCSRNFD